MDKFEYKKSSWKILSQKSRNEEHSKCEIAGDIVGIMAGIAGILDRLIRAEAIDY